MWQDSVTKSRPPHAAHGSPAQQTGLKVTVFCHIPCSTQELVRESLVLYYLARHPNVASVTLIPQYESSRHITDTGMMAQSGAISQNRAFFQSGQESIPAHVLGYDLKPVLNHFFDRQFALLREHALLKPDSRPATDAQYDRASLEDSQHVASAEDIRQFMEELLANDLCAAPKTKDDVLQLASHTGIDADNQNFKQSLDYACLRYKGYDFIPIEHINQSDVVIDLNGLMALNTANLFPDTFHLNNPATTQKWRSKAALPELAKALKQESGLKIVPECCNVQTEQDIHRFMDTHDCTKIVLKAFVSNQGKGVFKIERDSDGALTASYNGDALRYRVTRFKKPVSQLLKEHHGDGGMLAMEWLEPGKGDVRVICMGDTIIGAYNRMPQEGRDLCNIAQQGHGEPYSLTHAEHEKITHAMKHLAQEGQHFLAFDLMSNAKGERMITEVNLGCNAGGLDKIHDFDLQHHHNNRPPIGEQFVQAMVSLVASQHKEVMRR